MYAFKVKSTSPRGEIDSFDRALPSLFQLNFVFYQKRSKFSAEKLRKMLQEIRPFLGALLTYPLQTPKALFSDFLKYVTCFSSS